MTGVSSKEILKIRIQIICTNAFIPFLFLLVYEQLNEYFKTGLAIPLAQRGFSPVEPLILIMYAIMAFLTVVVLDLFLKPFYRYLKDDTLDSDKARKATIRVPFFLMSIHCGAWASGSTVFYFLKNFIDPLPYHFAMLMTFGMGLVGSFSTILVMNIILLPYKERLHVTDIRPGEKDFFARLKDTILSVSLAFYCISHLSYVAWFYYEYGREFPAAEDASFVILYLFLAFLILVAVVMTLLSRRDNLTQSNQLREKLNNLVEGGNLSDRVHILYFNELGDLADRINRFLDRFTSMIKQIQQGNRVILDSIQGIASSGQEISATSNQQAAGVKEIVSTVEESDRAIKDAAGRVRQVANLAMQTRDTVKKGASLSQEGLTKMDDIRKSNKETIRGIKELADQLEGVWEIVNIISGITTQTKIIAFNAELEASSVGEAGKNFEIVATEIRRLADNTQEATGRIRERITLIQQSADNLIRSSEQSTKRIGEGWEMTNRQGEAFDEISHSSQGSAESADKIAESVEQVVAASSQILLTLRQISEGINAFALTTKSTTQSAELLRDMAEGLGLLVSGYKI